jgi:hypothetical protein
MKQQPSQPIPEDRIPAILARAAELDRQSITLQALRTAAIDAGIGAAAVDQALQEYAAGKLAEPQRFPHAKPAGRWRRILRHIAYPFKIAMLGLAIGVLSAATGELTLFAVAALIALGGYFAWRDRFTGRSTRFQLSMTSLGFSMFMGMGIAGGDEDALALIAVIGIALLIMGTMLLHFQRNDEQAGEEASA